MQQNNNIISVVHTTCYIDQQPDASPVLFHDTHISPVAPMEVESSNEDIPISFEVPPQLSESSIEDDTPVDDTVIALPTVTNYEVIKGGSQKGKEKLADREGYTYTVKERRANGNTVWTCSVRNSSLWCKARVTQKADGFARGSQPHVHPPQLGAATAARVSTAVKKIAVTEIFTSAAEIVNKVCIHLLHYIVKQDACSGVNSACKARIICYRQENYRVQTTENY